MRATKMVVPIPDHVRLRRGIAAIHWYVICGGAWNNANVYVEPLVAGADIVLVTAEGKVVRWMYASRQNAGTALGRWNGDGEPPGQDMPDDLPTFTGAAP